MERIRRARPIVALIATLGVAAAIAPMVVAAPDGVDGPATATDQAVRVDPVVPFSPGNPAGPPLPADARPVDTSTPDVVVGTGTPSSCTSAAVVNAVAQGGVITFDCGPDPVTIPMTATAMVFNRVNGVDTQRVVIDGGGLVTLDGQGQRRILYMNTCDQGLVWTTPTCQNQPLPRLTLQRITFANGNSTGQNQLLNGSPLPGGGGGGAVFVRGGEVTVVDTIFRNNRCDETGPDVGGAALRVFSQFDGRPVVLANSTLTGGRCSNGAGTSSIGVSWRILNSVFTDNVTTGRGANPRRPGTPGGGNGGAIYLDGNEMTLELEGSIVRGNVANEGGGAVFFVSNNRTGRAFVRSSELIGNPSLGFETAGFPGIFHLGSGDPVVTDSVLS
ncbi:MAG: hypothetical protein AAF945_19135 [Actinomycetota bacterium]